MSTTGEKTAENVNAEEIKLIRAVVDEPLLKSVRALFLGLNPTKADKALVKGAFANKILRDVMKRRFYPTLDRDQPIGQVQDVWLGVEQMVFGMARDTIEQAVAYKELALDYTKKALALLENPEGEAVDLSYSPKIDGASGLQIKLLARNQFIRHVESQLLFLFLISKTKEEGTPKEQEEKKKKSGNK